MNVFEKQIFDQTDLVPNSCEEDPAKGTVKIILFQYATIDLEEIKAMCQILGTRKCSIEAECEHGDEAWQVAGVLEITFEEVNFPLIARIAADENWGNTAQHQVAQIVWFGQLPHNLIHEEINGPEIIDGSSIQWEAGDCLIRLVEVSENNIALWYRPNTATKWTIRKCKIAELRKLYDDVLDQATAPPPPAIKVVPPRSVRNTRM